MSKQYWLKRFKKGDYVQHLSGLTLSPSMHDHFVESWTESQEASHVSHFQAPENEKDKKTQGTYGQASQMQFDFADPDGSSSKTCQDWLPLGCVTSCKTWDKWVTERRGVYSVRKKLALHTKGNESSSWGTPQASDHIEGARTAKESNQKCLGRDLNQMQNWPTPTAMSRPRSEETMEKCLKFRKSKGKNSVPLYLEEKVRKEMNWPTPRAGNPGSRKPGTGGKILAEEAKIHNGLQDQEKSNTSGKNQESWLTPKSRDYRDVENHILRTGENVRKTGQKFSVGLPTQAHMKEFPEAKKAQAKLNPNWVEQLMGLSTGWTDLGSWEMELSPKPQN